MSDNLPAGRAPSLAAAKTAAEMIVRGAQTLYEGLYAFSKIKGWKLLGYETFGAWADENLQVARWTAYQELHRARALGAVADRLGLSVGEVAASAPVVPLHEAGPMADAAEQWATDDDQDWSGSTPEDAAAVLGSIKAEVVPSETAPSNRRVAVIKWALKIRRLTYPDAMDEDLRAALMEAREFIDDCLKEE